MLMQPPPPNEILDTPLSSALVLCDRSHHGTTEGFLYYMGYNGWILKHSVE